MPTTNRPRYLLVSDLDGTLLGDDAALDRFRAFHDRHRVRLGVVYASGRTCRSMVDVVRHTSLPAPLALIGSVGTEIWEYPAREPLLEWQEQLARGWDRDAVARVLDAVPGVAPQPRAAQTPLKISRIYENATRDQIVALERGFRDAGLEVTVIYSSDRHLDVLPAGADKGRAAEWLVDRWSYDQADVFAAGNSLNDEALVHNGFDGIVVANADEEFKDLPGDRVYVASGARADGVIEGLHHWFEGRSA